MNRWLGRWLAVFAYRARLTPNVVTALSGLVSGVGILVLALSPRSPSAALAVGGLLCLGYALDSADGQLARLSGSAGLAGEWLDHVVDAARMPALHLATVVHLRRNEYPEWAQYVAMAFLVVTTARFLSQILAEQMRKGRDEGIGANSGTPSQAARRALLQTPSDTGVLCLSYVLLFLPTVFVVVYTALAVANTGLAFASFRRRYTELSGLAGS